MDARGGKQLLNEKGKVLWVILLGGAALLLVLAVLWLGGGGKDETARVEEKPAAAPAVALKAPGASETQAGKEVGAGPAKPPVAVQPPEVQVAKPVVQPPPSLGVSFNEFGQRFNKNSERIKSKLRIRNFTITSGPTQDAYKHVFNENLYLVGKVNRADGSLAEINLFGVLNGSLPTAVDLNQGIGSIITAFIPGLSPEGREAILNSLGINKITSGIYNLNEQVTRNDVTYWVQSSRKEGLHFGVRSAR